MHIHADDQADSTTLPHPGCLNRQSYARESCAATYSWSFPVLITNFFLPYFLVLSFRMEPVELEDVAAVLMGNIYSFLLRLSGALLYLQLTNNVSNYCFFIKNFSLLFTIWPNLQIACPVIIRSTATSTVCQTYDPGGNRSLSSLSWYI